ncbi:MAG: GHMP kinase [Verrucomicrobia bacterium GWF2_62_7]|nr:MAG: GHMP kinase [Verrucomicrobia bacterium GWF2_62_7]
MTRKLRNQQRKRIINSVAPIRICDNGGWTDTWFAEHGKVFNIGVYPYAEVQLEVMPYDGKSDRIVIHAENYGERYVRHPDKEGWERHPLLEAAIQCMRVPKDLAFQVTIFSEAPAGAGTGTSAAVTVALIGALDRLTPGRLSPHEVAYMAHKVEVELLHQQCGIQDQLCSAYGGINYMEMHRFPHASVSSIQVPNAIWWELERRLSLVFLGKSHKSSEVHKKVIRELENAGPDCRKIADLRVTAEKSRDALYAGDFESLGRSMIENTEAQGRLHSELISPHAHQVIEIARANGALGWKVNGAGGEGGSITLLNGARSDAKRDLIRQIERTNSLFKHIPIYLSRHGLRTWETDSVV